MKKAIIKIPLRYQMFIPSFVGVVACACLCGLLTLQVLDEDRTYFGLEVASTISDSIRTEIESRLGSDFKELSKASFEFAGPGYRKIFERVSGSFWEQVIGITHYRKKEDGSYSIQSVANHSLIRDHDLPEDAFLTLNEANPLNAAELQHLEQPILMNRSFRHAEHILPVYSYVLALPSSEILVADCLGEKLNQILRRSPSVKAFLVSQEGTVVAHAEPSVALSYRAQAYSGFPLSLLPETWTDGASFSWKPQGKERLSLVSPTAVGGTYLYSEIEKRAFFGIFKTLAQRLFFAEWFLLGLLLLLCRGLAAGFSRSIQRTATAIENLAGDAEKFIEEIPTSNDLASIQQALSGVLPQIKQRYEKEFQQGQKDSQLGTAQAVRAAMANPVAGSFSGWEISAYRPNVLARHQDFWDFHSIGNKRQVILAKANVDEASGILLSLIARATLDNIRRFYSQANQAMPSLTQQLGILNATLYSVFKGRVCLLATAIELDLDSGNILAVNAGGATPILWNLDPMGTVRVDERFYASAQPALGARVDALYQATAHTLLNGDRILIHTGSLNVATSAESYRPMLVEALRTQGGGAMDQVKTALNETLEGSGASTTEFLLLGRPIKSFASFAKAA